MMWRLSPVRLSTDRVWGLKGISPACVCTITNYKGSQSFLLSSGCDVFPDFRWCSSIVWAYIRGSYSPVGQITSHVCDILGVSKTNVSCYWFDFSVCVSLPLWPRAVWVCFSHISVRFISLLLAPYLCIWQKEGLEVGVKLVVLLGCYHLTLIMSANIVTNGRKVICQNSIWARDLQKGEGVSLKLYEKR